MIQIREIETDKAAMGRHEDPKGLDEATVVLAEYIDSHRGQGRKHSMFARFFQDWDGEILETVYAIRCKKPKGGEDLTVERQMVFGGTQTRSWVSENLLFNSLAGYYVIWEDKPKGNLTFSPRMTKAKEGYHPGLLTAWNGTGIAELEALGNWPKYLGVRAMAEDCNPSEFLAFAKKFSEQPDLELFQKAGIGYLWKSKRFLAALKTKRKEILSYVKANIGEIRRSKPNGHKILISMDEGFPLSKCEEASFIHRTRRALKDRGIRFSEREVREVARYISKQRVANPDRYKDYLDASEALGRDMTARGVYFPRDYDAQLRVMQNELERARERESIAKQREKDESIAKRLEELNLPKHYAKSGFSVRILDTAASMVEIGNALHNCVGVSGYGLRMANGAIVVLAVYKDGKPVNCVEMTTPNEGCDHYVVVQNRGDFNLESACQKEETAFLQGYVALANETWRNRPAKTVDSAR